MMAKVKAGSKSKTTAEDAAPARKTPTPTKKRNAGPGPNVGTAASATRQRHRASFRAPAFEAFSARRREMSRVHDEAKALNEDLDRMRRMASVTALG